MKGKDFNTQKNDTVNSFENHTPENDNSRDNDNNGENINNDDTNVDLEKNGRMREKCKEKGDGEEINKEDRKDKENYEALVSKIKKLESKLKEYEDLVKRKVADFENLKKRTIEEKKVLNQVIAEKVILDFLPIVDNLERAIKAAKESEDMKALLEGITLIKDMFLDILENKYDVRPINSVGKDFDPKIHNALYRKEGDYDKIVVIEEIEKPYLMGKKVIRIGKVGVGIPKKKEEEKENEVEAKGNSENAN